MAFNEPFTYHEDFWGHGTQTTTADANGWAIVKVNGTSATAIKKDGAATGALQHLLDNTSEVQSITSYHKDTLSYDIDSIREFKIKLSASTVDAYMTSFYGMGGDHNSTLTSVPRVGFYVGASGAIFCCTDDGTTDSGNVATGYTLGSTDYVFTVNVSNKNKIEFFIHDGSSNRRVCESTVFSMSAYSDQLQPYLRTGKSEGTATITVDLDMFRVHGTR